MANSNTKVELDVKIKRLKLDMEKDNMLSQLYAYMFIASLIPFLDLLFRRADFSDIILWVAPLLLIVTLIQYLYRYYIYPEGSYSFKSLFCFEVIFYGIIFLAIHYTFKSILYLYISYYPLIISLFIVGLSAGGIY